MIGLLFTLSACILVAVGYRAFERRIGARIDRWVECRAWRFLRQQRARLALEDGLWERRN